MADKKIYIKISMNDSVAGNLTSANDKANTNTGGDTKTKEEKESDSLLNTLLVDNAKKVLQNAISQYGNLTGDTISARKYQNANKVTMYALAIATGGVVGAIGMGVDFGIEAFTSFVETRRANAQIELLRQRVGMSTLSRSRDTNG